MQDFIQFALMFTLFMLIFALSDRISNRNETIKALSQVNQSLTQQIEDVSWQAPAGMTADELKAAIDKTLEAVANKPRTRSREIRMAMWGVFSAFNTPRAVETIHTDPDALKE